MSCATTHLLSHALAFTQVKPSVTDFTHVLVLRGSMSPPHLSVALQRGMVASRPWRTYAARCQKPRLKQNQTATVKTRPTGGRNRNTVISFRTNVPLMLEKASLPLPSFIESFSSPLSVSILTPPSTTTRVSSIYHDHIRHKTIR